MSIEVGTERKHASQKMVKAQQTCGNKIILDLKLRIILFSYHWFMKLLITTIQSVSQLPSFKLSQSTPFHLLVP